MVINNIVDNLVINFLIEISKLLHIDLQNVPPILFSIVFLAVLDIFAGANISEPRLGFDIYLYLRKVPKFLPTYADILIILILGSISLRGVSLPSISGERVFVHQALHYRITIPKNWRAIESIPPYDSYIAKINTRKNVTFLSPSDTDYIFIGEAVESKIVPPTGFEKEVLSINNTLLTSIHTKSGFSVFDRRIFAEVEHDSGTLIILANSDLAILKKYLKTFDFIQ